jgi:hypothetical protein
MPGALQKNTEEPAPQGAATAKWLLVEIRAFWSGVEDAAVSGPCGSR